MSLRLGDTAPDFTAQSTEGTINFHEWIGESWAILFSHPRDFTPVCTTELGVASKMRPEFEARGVKLLGLSIDSVEDHTEWMKDICDTQKCEVNFPVIADKDKTIAEQYTMIHPNEEEVFTVRTVFIIDPDKKIRLMITYPMATGRNFDELLRVIDSLQRTTVHKVATPANWVPGEDVIIVPTVSDDEAQELFPEGFRTERPYLRWVTDPNDKKAQAA